MIYDHRDNIVEIRHPNGEWTRFRYDGFDQLTKIKWSDRTDIWRAEYDGLGRRVRKQYGWRTWEYYWDDDRLACEVDPEGRLRIYVYASEDAFVPFMWVDYASVDAEPADGRAYYIFTNQIGAPLRIEDASGREVWCVQRYDAYGAVEIDEGAEVACSLRWPGHFYDEETGLHYNRYRYYSPRMARYIQTDPLGVSGGLNTHAAPKNPVVFVDLLGLTSTCDGKTKAEDGGGEAKTRADSESDGTGGPAEGRANATRASVDDKLAKYLLNPEHPVGGRKAKWFEQALGFTRENADDLARQITFNPKTAVKTAVTEHGTKFNQTISITGANGKSIDVTFAWIRNNDGTVRLVTGIPTKR